MTTDPLHGHGGRPSLDVVFVCTGNRARSPLAEALFRRYAVGLETTVTSYGTLDADGLPALPQAVAAAAQLGVDLTGHRSRALHGVSLASADLVLGFEPHHISAAVVDSCARIDRTFLLAELVHLLDTLPVPGDPADVNAALAAADARRARARPDPRAVLDDPVGRSPGYMLEAAGMIDQQVRHLIAALFAVRPWLSGAGL